MINIPNQNQSSAPSFLSKNYLDQPNKKYLSDHGNLHDVALVLHDDENTLDMLIKNLPKNAEQLEKISDSSELSKITFFNLVKQSFRYLETIKDLQDARDDGGIGSKESQEKDLLRGRCHDATIDSINQWSRSLARADIDNSFMSGILSTPPNRAVYGMFAIGLALDIYTDEDFDIGKYSIDNIM